jgi:hypothetical protein
MDDFNETLLPPYCKDVPLFKHDGFRGSIVESSIGINEPWIFGKL